MPDAGETEEAVVEPTSLGYFIMQLPDDGNDDGMEPYPITMVGINALQKSHLKFGLTIEKGHFRVGRRAIFRVVYPPPTTLTCGKIK